MLSIYAEFEPTFLYIKRNRITGKLYFGKTIKDPIKYKGSGIYWTRHNKNYGFENVETLWYCLYTDKESIVEAAKTFSKIWNIVQSEDWLNLVEEDGIGGGNLWANTDARDNICKKLSEIAKGKPKSLEHKKSLSNSKKGKIPPCIYTRKSYSGANNPKAKSCISPCGKIFDCALDASIYFNTSAKNIQKYCRTMTKGWKYL